MGPYVMRDKIQVYDLFSKTLVHEHPPGNMAERGHNNRVCSLKTLDDGMTYISGGWDRNFMLWDLRKSSPLDQFSAVKVSGAAFDLRNGYLLAG